MEKYKYIIENEQNLFYMEELSSLEQCFVFFLPFSFLGFIKFSFVNVE